jgi:DNA-binding MarR family transcriptional regulator
LAIQFSKASGAVAPEASSGTRKTAMSKDVSRELRLGFFIHDVSRLRRNMVDRALKPMGLTRSQWWVLAFLSRRDGMPQVALADELDVGKVALGGLIDRLEASDLVERRGDPIDRRVKRVHLTKAGSKLVRDIRDSVAEVEKDIVAGIDESDLQATFQALKIMKSNLLSLLEGAKAESEDDADTISTTLEANG